MTIFSNQDRLTIRSDSVSTVNHPRIPRYSQAILAPSTKEPDVDRKGKMNEKVRIASIPSSAESIRSHGIPLLSSGARYPQLRGFECMRCTYMYVGQLTEALIWRLTKVAGVVQANTTQTTKLLSLCVCLSCYPLNTICKKCAVREGESFVSMVYTRSRGYFQPQSSLPVFTKVLSPRPLHLPGVEPIQRFIHHDESVFCCFQLYAQPNASLCSGLILNLFNTIQSANSPFTGPHQTSSRALRRRR